MAKHSHNYIVVRTVTKKDPKTGKVTTFKFMECINAGCPSPNKVETS
jgi:hypothetical protein